LLSKMEFFLTSEIIFLGRLIMRRIFEIVINIFEEIFFKLSGKLRDRIHNDRLRRWLKIRNLSTRKCISKNRINMKWRRLVLKRISYSHLKFSYVFRVLIHNSFQCYSCWIFSKEQFMNRTNHKLWTTLE
jgi:hypothetical protein